MVKILHMLYLTALSYHMKKYLNAYQYFDDQVQMCLMNCVVKYW